MRFANWGGMTTVSTFSGSVDGVQRIARGASGARHVRLRSKVTPRVQPRKSEERTPQNLLPTLPVTLCFWIREEGWSRCLRIENEHSLCQHGRCLGSLHPRILRPECHCLWLSTTKPRKLHAFDTLNARKKSISSNSCRSLETP